MNICVMFILQPQLTYLYIPLVSLLIRMSLGRDWWSLSDEDCLFFSCCLFTNHTQNRTSKEIKQKYNNLRQQDKIYIIIYFPYLNVTTALKVQFPGADIRP